MTIGILVSEILTGCGAAATMALTSRAALNLFLDDPAKNNLPTLRSVSAEDFDTIFMDVPGDKSWEILDFLSQNNPEVLTRVILIKNETCWTTNSCKIRQIELPIIPKSFLLNDLKHVACA
ncbi:MAG: hypothetical protein KAR11_04400 [Phycisphaerae bacterium]|nr:hypothetical protein [Phycisphaerae bacterium]